MVQCNHETTLCNRNTSVSFFKNFSNLVVVTWFSKKLAILKKISPQKSLFYLHICHFSIFESQIAQQRHHVVFVWFSELVFGDCNFGNIIHLKTPINLETRIQSEISLLTRKFQPSLGNITFNLETLYSIWKGHFEIRNTNVSKSKNHVSRLILVFQCLFWSFQVNVKLIMLFSN